MEQEVLSSEPSVEAIGDAGTTPAATLEATADGPFLAALLDCEEAAAEEREEALFFLFDGETSERHFARCCGVIVRGRDAQRAEALLAAGAPLVLLGEAALYDSELIARLTQGYPGRVGIYAPTRRMPVSWTLETESNADFKTLAPSICEPNWEILREDGSPTGTLLRWWMRAMRERGASCFLVEAEVRDDADLNILAGLVEDFDETLWLTPRPGKRLPFSEWQCYGHCRRFALRPHQRAEFQHECGPQNEASDIGEENHPQTIGTS